jgi:tetratricopeptide (TPR) repeat protein
MDMNPWNDLASVLERAHAAQQKGDAQLAYELYARALELDPNTAEGWQGRAATSTLPDDALVSLAYAVALQPENEAQRQELERQLATRLNSAQSEEEAPALVVDGQKLAQVGLTHEAQQLLRRAIGLDHMQEDARLWLAGTTDDPREAESLLREVLARNPENEIARAGLEAVTQQGEHASSAPVESTPAKPEPSADPAVSLVRGGEQALAHGDLARAHELFVRATEMSPHSEGAWLGRARASSDIDETLTCLEQALAINPNNVQAREARTFYRVRKLREGMKKTLDPAPELASTPDSAPRNGASTEVGARSNNRLLLLGLLVLILLALILVAYLRLQG